MVDDDDDLRFGDVSGGDGRAGEVNTGNQQPEALEGLPDSIAQLIQLVIMLFVLGVIVWTLGQMMLEIVLLI